MTKNACAHNALNTKPLLRVRATNEVTTSPSLNWMKDQGYLSKVTIPGKRAFYVITKVGAGFADLKEAEPEVTTEDINVYEDEP